MDNYNVASETKAYQKTPDILSFADIHGQDNMKKEIVLNYRQIKMDIVQIIEIEIERIKNDPNLEHLVKKKVYLKKDV